MSGQAVRDENVAAIQSVATIVRTSLGPSGLDKMLVDSIGDVTITNDGATIMRLLDISHPAARILADLAAQQDEEVGDGTTSVVVFAAELLRRANDLVKRRIHPTTVISGYRLACREAVRYIQDHVGLPVDTLGRQCVVNCARTSLNSKILGGEENGPFFAAMAVDALTLVKTGSSYPVAAVNILKAMGRSMVDSVLVHGYALNCSVASQAMVKRVKGARIAILDMNLQRARMHMGVSVQIDDPSDLEAVRRREIEICTERIAKILAAGANVVLTAKGIDDLALKPFVEAGAIAVRRCLREDLVRIAKATGATLVSSLANLEGGESFEAALLGSADEVVQERFGDNECLLVKGTRAHPAASIILRGANGMMLDEMERAMHDALCVVKRTLESGRVVPGGGATETATAVFLDSFAMSIASREQMAVAEFADALLVLPKTLAINSGSGDAMELVARLRAAHFSGQAATSSTASLPSSGSSTSSSSGTNAKYTGLDLDTGVLRDSVAAGVLEPMLSKIRSLKSATEAAISILRIDDMMTINPPPKGAEDECQ